MTFIDVLKYGFYGPTPDKTADLRMMVIFALVTAVVSYLIGSINWGVILSSKQYGKDVRNYGSGNAGATNMMRTFGKRAGAKTFLLDFLKAMVASFVGRIFLGLNGAFIAGFFCIIGHAFPIFFKFKGGKGVVAITAMCFFTDWRVFLIMFVIYAVVIAGYKMVSLASCMVAALYPLVLYPFIGPSLGIIFAFLSSAFVIYFHRENIKRIYHHTESKLNFSKKSKKNEAADTENDGE